MKRKKVNHRRIAKIKFWHVATALISAAVIFSAVLAFSPAKKNQYPSDKLKATSDTSAPITDVSGQPALTVSSPSTLTVSPNETQTVQSGQPTITAFEEIPIPDSQDKDCKVTYSDGTDYQWHWIIVDEHGDWATDSSGHNGHWETQTHISRHCDSSLIGEANPQ